MASLWHGRRASGPYAVASEIIVAVSSLRQVKCIASEEAAVASLVLNLSVNLRDRKAVRCIHTTNSVEISDRYTCNTARMKRARPPRHPRWRIGWGEGGRALGKHQRMGIRVRYHGGCSGTDTTRSQGSWRSVVCLAGLLAGSLDQLELSMTCGS